MSLSMYSSDHPAEHRFPVWWTGDVVYTMLYAIFLPPFEPTFPGYGVVSVPIYVLP